MEKKLIEAALFMSSRPLDLNELAKISGISSLGYVKDLLEKLKKDYERRGIRVVNSPQGWEFQVRQDLLPKVAHLTPYSDISEGSKRSLALIVAREPLKQSELVGIQGNKSYSYIKELEKRGLVKSERHGRSRILTLSQEFERYFGEDKNKIKKMLQESVGYKKEKIQDFVSPEKEKKSEDLRHVKNEEKKETPKFKEKKGDGAKSKKKEKFSDTEPERKEADKNSAGSGEIPW